MRRRVCPLAGQIELVTGASGREFHAQIHQLANARRSLPHAELHRLSPAETSSRNQRVLDMLLEAVVVRKNGSDTPLSIGRGPFLPAALGQDGHRDHGRRT